MVREGAVQRVVGWLRAGYPTGVPEQDYVALLALLRRRLTDDEIAEVVAYLQNEFPEGDATRGDVHVAIERLIEQPPLPADVSRVSSVLASVGWPLAALEDDEV
jgi:hypothetical protein